MSLSRRQFLLRAAGSGIALGLGGLPLVAKGLVGHAPRTPYGLAAPAGTRLRIPAVLSGDTITAAATQLEIWPGTQSDVWAYNGTLPGPTVVTQKGATFNAKLVNQLGEPTIIHWHGLTLPAAMDGHPRSAIDGGGHFDYAFTVEQRAGTYWYHPHPDMRTGRQVYMGMAGLFIVHDPEEEALGLPRDRYDIPLLMQDRRSTFVNSFEYTLGDQDILEGILGDYVLVNGTVDAYHEVDRGLYRLRLLNGSNARILKLAFSDGQSFHLIASDGGLLDKPVEVSQLTLGPAERAEILVSFATYEPGASVTLKTLHFDDPSGGGQGREMAIVRFDVLAAEGAPAVIPSALSTIERLDPAQATESRTFDFRSDFGSPPMHTINGKMFDMMRVDATMRPGDVEVWTFMNRSQMPHPIHMHGGQFQVIDVGGNTELAPEFLGWKDTVLTQPYEPVRVVVKIPRHLGIFLLHCHNLEHEDHGMMMNFEVTNTTGVEDEGYLGPKEMDLSRR